MPATKPSKQKLDCIKSPPVIVVVVCIFRAIDTSTLPAFTVTSFLLQFESSQAIIQNTGSSSYKVLCI